MSRHMVAQELGMVHVPSCHRVYRVVERSKCTSFMPPTGMKQCPVRTFVRTRQRRASSRPVMTVSCVAAASFSEDDGQIEHVFAQALLLCFLACQNRSFFASKCFVECVIGMYKRGYSLDAMKRIVTFGTLSAGGMEQPMMQDIMLTWMTLVYLTLDEIGLVKDGKAAAAAAVQETDDDDEGSSSSEGMVSNTSSVMIRGLRDIATTWIDQFKNGMTLRQLQLQQSMQGLSTADEEPGEFVRVMQQNSRLVLLALQVVRDSGETCEKISLDINHSDDDDSVIESPLHYAMTGFIRGMMDMPADPLDGSVSSREEDLRETAVRLLLSFNGAVLGYLSPAQSFVSTAAYCYVSGWTADEVYMVLRPEEFEQSGGLVKVARPPGGTNASATLFARWISIVYMTMAKLGVMHPKASESQGWAWVGSADGQQGGGGNLEALGVSDFITHTLRAASDTPVQENSVDGGFSFKFEDPDLMRQSGFALVLMQQISLVHMTKQLLSKID